LKIIHIYNHQKIIKMAQLSSTTINGAILVGCTCNLSKVGNIWYCTTNCTMYYSYCNGASIVAKALGA
jgi:hypothetical protein